MKLSVLFICALLSISLVLSLAETPLSHEEPVFPLDTIVSTFGKGIGSASGTTSQTETISAGGKDVNLPAGSNVEVSDGVLKADRVDFASTPFGAISGGSDVTILKDGSFTSSRADHVGKGGVDLFAVAPVEVTKEKVLFGEGDLLFDGEYFDDVRNGEIFFTDGVVSSLRFEFSKGDTFVLKNHLSSCSVTTYADIIDSDSDGLPDDFEMLNGLNASSVDSDSDGLSDAEEVFMYPTDGTKFNTFSGVPNVTRDKEFVAWLNANSELASGDIGQAIITLGLKKWSVYRDSDGDGVSDLKETEQGFNPQKYDSDGDVLGDKEEILMNKNPLLKNEYADVKAKEESCADALLEISFFSS